MPLKTKKIPNTLPKLAKGLEKISPFGNKYGMIVKTHRIFNNDFEKKKEGLNRDLESQFNRHKKEQNRINKELKEIEKKQKEVHKEACNEIVKINTVGASILEYLRDEKYNGELVSFAKSTAAKKRTEDHLHGILNIALQLIEDKPVLMTIARLYREYVETHTPKAKEKLKSTTLLFYGLYVNNLPEGSKSGHYAISTGTIIIGKMQQLGIIGYGGLEL